MESSTDHSGLLQGDGGGARLASAAEASAVPRAAGTGLVEGRQSGSGGGRTACSP